MTDPFASSISRFLTGSKTKFLEYTDPEKRIKHYLKLNRDDKKQYIEDAIKISTNCGDTTILELFDDISLSMTIPRNSLEEFLMNLNENYSIDHKTIFRDGAFYRNLSKLVVRHIDSKVDVNRIMTKACEELNFKKIDQLYSHIFQNIVYKEPDDKTLFQNWSQCVNSNRRETFSAKNKTIEALHKFFPSMDESGNKSEKKIENKTELKTKLVDCDFCKDKVQRGSMCSAILFKHHSGNMVKKTIDHTTCAYDCSTCRETIYVEKNNDGNLQLVRDYKEVIHGGGYFVGCATIYHTH